MGSACTGRMTFEYLFILVITTQEPSGSAELLFQVVECSLEMKLQHPHQELFPFVIFWLRESLPSAWHLAAVMAIGIRAEDSKDVLATISCFYMLPPQYWRSSAEIKMWCYKQRLASCTEVKLHTGQDGTRPMQVFLMEQTKLNFCFLAVNTSPTQLPLKNGGRAASALPSEQPCPTQPKPSPTTAIPLLVGKGGSGCLL